MALTSSTTAASLLFAPFLLLALNSLPTTSGQYMVEILERTALGGHRAIVRCDATGANFGEDVMAFSFGMNAIGCALFTEPPLACTDVEKPELNSTTQCIVDFAVVSRGNCSFSEKAYYTQSAKPSGYQALIVYNGKGQSPIPMSGSKFAELVQIPIVMVKYECMQSMFGHYSAEHGYMVTIKASPGYYDLVKYLFPFVIIVGICFIVLFISLMVRLCRERRRLARKRLPRSYLKKIPTKKYRKGDPEETCAICLEDFQEGEKLRILPCRHAYHCKCIDPWLTKNRKVCPVCKRRVGPRSDDSSDTDDTDTERAPRSAASSSSSAAAEAGSSAAALSRDNDPLLRNAQPMATSSSGDFPYPSPILPSLQQPTTSTAANSAFMRATNFFHLGNIFQPSRCELNVAGTGTGDTVTATASGTVTTTLAEPHQAGSLLHPASGFEDLTATRGEAVASATGLGPTGFGHLRSGLSAIGSRLAGLVHRNGSNPGNPHLLLENEEDASVTTREELDTLSRHTCETLDETNSSSADGNSMTTMHSNRNLLAVAVEVEESTPMPNTTPTHCQQQQSDEPVVRGGGGRGAPDSAPSLDGANTQQQKPFAGAEQGTG